MDKRLEKFKERSHRMIGKVHDPIRETMDHLSPHHVFGLKFPADEYGVSQLVQPSKTAEEKGDQLTEKVNNKPFESRQPLYPAFGAPTVLVGRKPKYYVKSLADSNVRSVTSNLV